MTQTNTNSLSAMLNIVSDRWILLLLRELYLGATSWSQFTEALDISPAILNKRLKLLIDVGCLNKHTHRGKRDTAYELTAAGEDLFPFLAAAREWQVRWDSRRGAFISPYIHECGTPLRSYSACLRCNEPLTAADVRLPRDHESIAKSSDARHFRLSSNAGADLRSPSAEPPKIIQILGDRRASELVSVLAMGPLKFDELTNKSGLHPAIVTERLRKLQLLDLCQQRLYQERPDRYVYSLTAAATDLFEVAIHLRQWAERWLGDHNPNEHRIHLICGHTLHTELRCKKCHRAVNFESITVNI